MPDDTQATDLTPFEASLSQLSPVGGPSRDRLMYEAGRRAAMKRHRYAWLWPALAASLGLLAACQTVVLFNRPTHRVVERIVVQNSSESNAESDAPIVILARRHDTPTPATALADAEAEYPALTPRIARRGLDATTNPLAHSAFRVVAVPDLDRDVLNPRSARLVDPPDQIGGPS